ncbi:MAG: hypothetical protein KDK41_09775 [Leptospiraceae bacterium]|nr:hypothetical protein [Leptospiraceae bacterium]
MAGNRKNKKDLFSKATREQINPESIDAERLKTSIGEQMSAPDDNQEIISQDIAEIAKESGQKLLPPKKDQSDENETNVETKKSLQNASPIEESESESRKSKMDDNKVKKLESRQLKSADFKYKDGSMWRKIAIIAAVLSLLGGAAWYFFMLPPKIPPRIYLSTSSITESMLPSLPVDNQVIPAGRSIYVYFANGRPLGVQKIFIKVTEITRSNTQAVKELQIANHEASVDPRYHRIYTLFQSDYFDRPGNYKIRISDQNGQELAVRNFTIKGNG